MFLEVGIQVLIMIFTYIIPIYANVFKLFLTFLYCIQNVLHICCISNLWYMPHSSGKR